MELSQGFWPAGGFAWTRDYCPTCFAEQLAFVQHGSLTKSSLCPTWCFAQYVASVYYGFLFRWESSILYSRPHTQYGALWSRGLLLNMGLCPNGTYAQNGDSVQSGILTSRWFLPNQELSHHTRLYGTGGFALFGSSSKWDLFPTWGFCWIRHSVQQVTSTQPRAFTHHGALCSWWLLSVMDLCWNEVCVQHGDSAQSEILPNSILSSRRLQHNMKLLSNQGLEKRKCIELSQTDEHISFITLSCFVSFLL